MVDVVLAKMESIGSETDARGLHPPFGILYLADSLEKAGFSVRLIHDEGTEANIQRLVDLVSAERPSFVGFSVVTGPSIIPSLKATRVVKEKFDIPIVWGGLQPTLLPRESLAHDYIDVLGLGEGEETIVELAAVIRQHGLKASELERVAGIAIRKDGHIAFTESRPFIKDLDGIYAAWHHLDMERYIRPEIYLDTALGGVRAIAVNTSRGCPWRCGYCYNLTFNKRTFRAQSAKRLAADIQDLKERYDVSGIRFSEDHFFSNPRRAREVIRNMDLPWTATIRVNDLSEGGDDFARDLADNHCALLRCGVESGSQRVLDLIHKDITVDQARKAAALCAKYHIKVGFFFMLGFPGESWAEVCETLDLMDELEAKGDCIQPALPSIFCPYPGTPLLDAAIEQGFEPPASLEEWGTTVDMIVRHTGHLPPYVDGRVDRIIEYLRLARVRDFGDPILSLPARALRHLARARWKRRFFSFPLDWYVADWGRRTMQRAGRM